MTERTRTPNEDELRRVAIRRLKRKQDLRSHVFVYAVVNITLWSVWIAGGLLDTWIFPWPVFPTVFWGLFVLGQANDLYRRDALREDLVRREIEQLRAMSDERPLDTYDTQRDDWWWMPPRGFFGDSPRHDRDRWSADG